MISLLGDNEMSASLSEVEHSGEHQNAKRNELEYRKAVKRLASTPSFLPRKM
jgi:hypothetical protein